MRDSLRLVATIALTLTLIACERSAERNVEPGASSKPSKEQRRLIRPSNMNLEAPAPRTSAEWQKLLYDPRTVTLAFNEAVLAAVEAKDTTARRELHTLALLCTPVFDYLRQPLGERAKWLEDHRGDAARDTAVADNFSLCKLVYETPWASGEIGNIDHGAHQGRGIYHKDPLAWSIYVGKYAEELQRTAEEGQRDFLRKKIAEHARFAARSGDATAWFDLGSRLLDGAITKDPSYGYAYMLVACERGYDCSDENRHNHVLDCRVARRSDCANRTTLEKFRRQQQQTAPNVAERVATLKALIQTEDWFGVERFAPLNGNLFP
jgi:hypothetical protein